MDLTDSQIIKKLCQEYGLQPSRSNGQNFLIDKNILEKMVTAGEIKKDDMILEIGPGFGVLTQELLKCSGRLAAVEKDKRLAGFLAINNKQQVSSKKLEIIDEDILRFKIDDLEFKNFKIISNLPYQITSPVLWKFLHEEKNKPQMMVLMVQKEVGERICAKPGKMSILSVLCQLYADCAIVARVGRNCFWPVPEVDSLIIKLKTKNDIFYCHREFMPGSQYDNNIKDLLKLVKIGFSAKRKMLKNNLAAGYQLATQKVAEALRKVGLDEKVRAQELGIEEWQKIYNILFLSSLPLEA